MSRYYHICPLCGSYLDPGERCSDCQDKKEAAPSAANAESGKADLELSDPRSASHFTE